MNREPVNWVAAVAYDDGGTSRSIPVLALSPMGAATQALEILGVHPEIRNAEVIVYRSTLDGGDGSRYRVIISVDHK